MILKEIIKCIGFNGKISNYSGNIYKQFLFFLNSLINFFSLMFN